MLRLQGPQAECLWDEVLPAEVRELPEDLARIDRLLGDPALLEPIAEHWRSEALERGRDASAHGRPTIPMASYVRLMVVKHRSGWGYETLLKEVSDSLHLRRFCLLAIDARVPDESTVRKLTRRLGPETVAQIIRAVIAKAARERRFSPRAARIDSTVIEADVRATPARTRCCPRPRPRSRAWTCVPKRLLSTAASVTSNPTSSSPRSSPNGSSSRAAENRLRRGPGAACAAIGPAPRAGSLTSSAPTD